MLSLLLYALAMHTLFPVEGMTIYCYHIEYTVTWTFLVDSRLVRGSGLRGQDILLEFKASKGVYQLLSNKVVEAEKIYCLSMTF